MISIKKILTFALILLVLPMIQALTTQSGNTVIGIWYDQYPSLSSISQADGSTVNFNVYALALGSPLQIRVDVILQNGTVIAVDSVNIGSASFNEFGLGAQGDYSITNAQYGGPGNHQIRLRVTGTTTSTLLLNLAITPSTPLNNAPVINSNPITSIAEGQFYTYQINATDADGNTLNYGFVQNPGSFLSVNATSGFISGTTPMVANDTNYTFIVRVTDGLNITLQNWTLTVLDTNATNDTVAPVVNIVFPTSIVYDSDVSSISYTAVDAAGNLNACWYSLNGGILNSTMDTTCSTFSGLSSVEGTNTWTVYARDIFGNVGMATITFLVDSTIDDDDDDGSGGSSTRSSGTINYRFENPNALYADNFVPETGRPINLVSQTKTQESFLVGFFKAIWELFSKIAEALI